MIKLQKFNKQNKLKQIKTIVISGVILIIALISLIVFKSYAYYKQSNSYDVIKSKIGEFSKSDIQLAYTINGVKQSGSAFPAKDTGYEAKSVTCDNGVTADWNDELWGLVNINSNNQEKISCKVDFRKIDFAIDNWTTIANNVKTGSYSYQVGDKKTIDMGEFGTHKVRIANISGCTNGETSETACGFVLEFADIINEHEMNSTNTNVGGWPASELRTYANSTIYQSLPSDLQSVIIDTKVISGHGSSAGETNFESTDKLYLLNAQEIWGSNENDTSVGTSKQLDYYKNLGVTSENYSAAIKQYNKENYYWWLRSAYPSSYNDEYLFVDSDGSSDRLTANDTNGVSLAFRLA